MPIATSTLVTCLVLLTAALAAVPACTTDGTADPGASAQVAESLADYQAFSGLLLALFEYWSDGNLDTTSAPGVVVTLDEEAGKLTLEFMDPDAGLVEGPIDLFTDPSAPAGRVRFRGEGLTLFGESDLVVQVGLTSEPAGDGLFVRIVPALSVLAGPPDLSNDLSRRTEFIRHFNENLAPDPTLSDVDRFALIVQHVVDTDLALTDGELGENDFLYFVARDLAELFLSPNDSTKTYLFLGHPIVITPAVSAGTPIPEGTDRTGFRHDLRKGNGRHRHFAANFLAMTLDGTFGILTNLAARFIGNDWEWKDDPTGAIASDLATNELGREFHGFLSDLFSDIAIEDRESVANWIRDKFGNQPPEICDFSATLDGTAIRFEVTAVDPETRSDEHPVTYTWQLSGAGANCGSVVVIGGGGTMVWDIENCEQRDIFNTIITVTATDTDGARATFSILANPVENIVIADKAGITSRGVFTDRDSFGPNRPPQLVQFLNVTNTRSHFFTMYAMDPEGEALTYEWTLSGPGANCGTISGSDSETLIWNHEGCDPADVANTQITVVVRDASGNESRYTQLASEHEGTGPVFNPGG